ncbi:hypothetical protein QFZ68_007337 [Streptomyces sp. V1I6]|nr:hypothetical protein [Streptomyces sp. V1I6]
MRTSQQHGKRRELRPAERLRFPTIASCSSVAVPEQSARAVSVSSAVRPRPVVLLSRQARALVASNRVADLKLLGAHACVIQFDDLASRGGRDAHYAQQGHSNVRGQPQCCCFVRGRHASGHALSPAEWAVPHFLQAVVDTAKASVGLCKTGATCNLGWQVTGSQLLRLTSVWIAHQTIADQHFSSERQLHQARHINWNDSPLHCRRFQGYPRLGGRVEVVAELVAVNLSRSGDASLPRSLSHDCASAADCLYQTFLLQERDRASDRLVAGTPLCLKLCQHRQLIARFVPPLADLLPQGSGDVTVRNGHPGHLSERCLRLILGLALSVDGDRPQALDANRAIAIDVRGACGLY